MHDVRVADLRECSRLVHEACLDGFFGAVAPPEYFDRHLSVQSLVISQQNPPHSADANVPENLVPGESLGQIFSFFRFRS